MRPVLLCILLVSGSVIPASAQQLKEITNSIGMKLVLIHAGSFTMGSPMEEGERHTCELLHGVTIGNWFYLGVHEVTQQQYESVLGNNPSSFKGAKNPVESVSWEEACLFCKKLSESQEERAVGRVYRLPTEAEWEYACRASSTTRYCSGDSEEALEDYAWFRTRFEDKSHPVGQKKPNRWGLFDMHGNVSEWCQDWASDYPSKLNTDPFGPSAGSEKVYRGGSWFDDSSFCRSARRDRDFPSPGIINVGFRVAMSRPVKRPESASSK